MSKYLGDATLQTTLFKVPHPVEAYASSIIWRPWFHGQLATAKPSRVCGLNPRKNIYCSIFLTQCYIEPTKSVKNWRGECLKSITPSMNAT